MTTIRARVVTCSFLLGAWLLATPLAFAAEGDDEGDALAGSPESAPAESLPADETMGLPPVSGEGDLEPLPPLDLGTLDDGPTDDEPEEVIDDEDTGGDLPMRFPGRSGEIGLWNMASARVGRPLTFGLSLHGEYMDSPEFPRNFAKTQFFKGTLALTFTPVKYLEIFAGMTSSGVRSDDASPNLVQALGDAHFGLKGTYPALPILHIGLDVTARFLNPLGDLGLAFEATSGTARGLVTLDLTEMDEMKGSSKSIPFRAHLNFGFTLDRSEWLITGDEQCDLMGNCIRPVQNIGPVERFALGLSKYNSFDLAVGIEVPLPKFYINPFVEWGMRVPFFPAASRIPDPGTVPGDVGYPEDPFICRSPGFENCPRSYDLDGDGIIEGGTAEVGTSGFGSFPNILTVGVRVAPPIRGLSIDLSADIGLTRDLVWGLAANRQYSVNFGLTYTYDPKPRVKTVTKVEEKIVEVGKPVELTPPPPSEAVLMGSVKDANTGAPVAGAIVDFIGKGKTPMATAADGTFESYPFPFGALVVDLQKEGYEPATETIKIEEGGASITIEMIPVLRKSTLSGSVRDATKGTPVDASLTLRGADGTALTLAASGGTIKGEVDAGSYTVEVSAPGYLKKAMTISPKGGDSVAMEVELRKALLKPLAVLKKDRIIIKRKVLFDTGKATIKTKSHELLDYVADVILSNPGISISIEGHTDSTGKDDFNKTLSEDRAYSVRDYLISGGVDPTRLTSTGFGEEKPLVPNTTARNKAKNRRVEFHVK